MKKFALISIFFFLIFSTPSSSRNLGIEGQTAPEIDNLIWFDENGKESAPLKLADYRGKVVYMDFFQSWCPGCLSHSLPRLSRLSGKYRGNPNVKFLAIQTVFEGFFINTKAKVLTIKKRFGLQMPMAHDDGAINNSDMSVLVRKYRSGGTPWTVIIDPDGKVVFNQFHITEEQASEIIESLSASIPAKG